MRRCRCHLFVSTVVAGALLVAACGNGGGGLSPGPGGAAPGPVAAPAPSPVPGQTADSFFSDGGLLSGWYWLSDSAGQAYAQWVFRNTEPQGPFHLAMELLATNEGDGGSGYPARFWLTYGPAGDGGLYPSGAEPLFVELPNVSSPTEPYGYTTRGTVTLDLGALPAHADGIWVKITRRAPGAEVVEDGGTGVEAYHIAVHEGSVTIAGTPDCDPLADDAAEGFTSDGDFISGWYWLRDAAGQQHGQWVFRHTINSGAFELNLEVLATDTFNGGPGYPAHFWLTYGAVYEHGLGPAADDPLLVELPNVSPPDDPVGYTARGSVTLVTGSLPSSADGIWVQIARVGVDGSLGRYGTSGAVQPYHIAVNETSVTIQGTWCGSPDGSDESLPPDTSSTTTSSSTTTTVPDPDLEDLPPMVISLGDSYISGEAGRWAGNPTFLLGYPSTDALGSSAYWDGPGFSEAIAGCHRSRSAAIHIGQAEDGTSVTSVNLACSGARTYTQPGKPGVDRCTSEANATGSNRVRWIGNSLYANPYPCSGVTGQVELLRQTMAQAAGSYHVKMVVVSIGGNNFGFGDIVEQCVWNFLTMRDWDPGFDCVMRVLGRCVVWVPRLVSKDFCSDDAVAGNVTDPKSLEARELEIATSLWDIIDVMEEAGYTADDWTLLVNTYPSPIPDGDGFRYIETGWSRHSDGGCGFWDEDADWANATALPNITATVKDAVSRIEAPNARVLDVSQAFVGRRLCEEGVHKVGLVSLGPTFWWQTNAVDRSEWVQEIRGILSQGGAIDVYPFYADESFHPNYWGQLALRSCVRQAFNNGAPIGGRCVRAGNGLSGRGEPRMDVVP